MLKIEDLHAEINGREILRGINLEIKPGEVHAIMGPNGSGKSTLSMVLAGNPAYTPTGGSVSFNGKDLLAMPPKSGVMKVFSWASNIRWKYPVCLWSTSCAQPSMQSANISGSNL